MQVQVATVLEGAQVQRALQMFADGIAIEQVHQVAHATALGFVVARLQFIHVRRLHRCVQVPALEIAVDAVALHAPLDDLVAPPAQVPDEIVHVFTQALAHLRAHGLVTRQAAGDLTAVASASAPADAVGFDNGHLQAAFGQFHGGGDARETAADDGHVDLLGARQGGVLGRVVERGGVVGRRPLGRPVVHC